MQKLEKRNTYTPTGTPQARSNCDPVIKQSCGVGSVLQGSKTFSNSSDVDLLQHAGGPKANVYAYVLNLDGKPLMPCKPAKARHLLRDGKAIVVKRKPFTIRLLWDCEDYTQPIVLGLDPGYRYTGFSARSGKKELISGTVVGRTDIPKKMKQRRSYRRTRRGRLWYREPRFDNRKKEKGWLAPSIQHKVDSFVRLVQGICNILPVTMIIVEVAGFDIQKIKNPGISGKGYQTGLMKGFWNVREYVLHRDDHLCQKCKGKSKDKILQVHHVHGKKEGATDRPEELLTVCKTCHKNHHKGIDLIPDKEIKRFKAETFMTTVRWIFVNKLKEIFGDMVYYTYGYITKSNRIGLGLEKSHVSDALSISMTKSYRGIPLPIFYSNPLLFDRCESFDVKQVRRNNRSLQTNRKGFRRSIRRKRYPFQPYDLVGYDGEHRVKGSHCYGTRLVLDNNKSVDVNRVELITYGKGLCYA